MIIIRRKIGILCSGGDAPGINNVINKLYFELFNYDIELYGFIDGFQGIYKKNYKLITQLEIDGKQFQGGSIIGCERFNQLLDPGIFKDIINNLKELKIEELIIFGGDGSLKGAKLFQQENIIIHFIPTTIDNNVKEIENTLGFKTALQTVIELVSKLNDTGVNHQKINIIEVMGGTAPDLSIYSGLACNADFVININNYKDKDLYQNLNNIIKKSTKRSPIIIVSEQLLNIYEIANNIISNKHKWITVIGHIQRGGVPTYEDLILGNRIATVIVSNILHNSTKFIYGQS